MISKNFDIKSIRFFKDLNSWQQAFEENVQRWESGYFKIFRIYYVEKLNYLEIKELIDKINLN